MIAAPDSPEWGIALAALAVVVLIRLWPARRCE
jgi:hypothetical protein